MTPVRLAQVSHRMAAVTLVLIVVMLMLNTLSWLFPSLASREGWGLAFALTDRQLSDRIAMAQLFPWWKTSGGILLSSVPLMALTIGLGHLRKLFLSYASGDYFSSEAALHMGKVGKAVAFWVLLDFLCEPMLSLWMTMNEPVGERLFTVSFTAATLVALFLAACVSIIAHILRRATEVAAENRTFI